MIRITSETWNDRTWADPVDYWLDPLPPRERYRDTLAALASFHNVINSLDDINGNVPNHHIP